MLVFKEELKQHSKDVRDYAEKFRDIWDALLRLCCSSAIKATIQSNRGDGSTTRPDRYPTW